MTKTMTTVALAAALLLCPLAVSAQQVEITPFVGYMFGGDFRSSWDDDDRYRNLNVKEAANYGLMVDFAITRSAMIELIWVRQSTELEIPPIAAPSATEFTTDLDVDYFHAGFMWQWTPSNIRPYVVGTLGGTSFSPDGSGSTTKFSTSIGGGVKLFMGNHFGFRFDGRIYSTYVDSDTVVYCNPYYCANFNDSTYFVQWDAKAGVIVAF